MPDLLAREWITLSHGKPKCGKSQVAQAVVCAALTGGDFLGRPVAGIERILVIDEENPADVVNARLKAMGYQPGKHDDRLYYMSQSGFKIGLPDWNHDLLDFAERYRPDLVVIDSMFRATNATWANETITPLFDVFRGLANNGAAVWPIHHDKKDSPGSDIHSRASGGDQWMAQIDRQIAFEQTGAMQEAKLDDGSVKRSFPIVMEGGHTRMGSPFPKTYLSIASESEPADPDLLRRMWLEIGDGPSTPKDGKDWRPTGYMERVSKVVEDSGGATYRGIFDALVGKKSRDYVRRAVNLLIEEGYVGVEEGARGSQMHHSIRPFRE